MSTQCIRLLADPLQIKACKKKIKSAQPTFSGLSAILALAGNEVRLKILYLLSEEGKLCPCDLSDILEMSIPAISQHLRKLKDGGLVQTKKEGQTIYYSISHQGNPRILKSMFNLIHQQKEKWQAA